MRKKILLSLAAALAGTTMVMAGTPEDQASIKSFLEFTFKSAPVQLAGMDFGESTEINGTDWRAYRVDITVNSPQGSSKVPRVLFTNGSLVAGDLYNVKDKEVLSVSMSPAIQAQEYTDDRHVAGNKDAEHKIIVFSDPLCPFCIEAFPELVRLTEKNPEKLGLYLVHTPIERLHPASPALSKAIIAGGKKGIKDAGMKIYTGKFTVTLTDEEKILGEVNKQTDMNLTVADINTPEILEDMKKGQATALDYMVEGTPIIFLDGKRIQGFQEITNVIGEQK